MLEAAQLGNVATRLLFENERVKVWEMRLEPGHLFFVPRGGTERAVNRSGTRFRELLVELKDAQACASSPSPAAG